MSDLTLGKMAAHLQTAGAASLRLDDPRELNRLPPPHAAALAATKHMAAAEVAAEAAAALVLGRTNAKQGHQMTGEVAGEVEEPEEMEELTR